eukprot:CAMPEP_0203811116 /NCGR_PEP_ID=MMETSP0115-20131106/3361_1 /ASSEMBLY_ACC=CAM_ASM_000227 /TAXON_ID=33651 /ORGANISM="Bicosoecid sp, Strain ms1" /LENGTH=53 /DNA_ID=CAMNT_0050719927 /DNA_START=53 /DNA_END=211 /DNA_ORIENTATION=-
MTAREMVAAPMLRLRPRVAVRAAAAAAMPRHECGVGRRRGGWRGWGGERVYCM